MVQSTHTQEYLQLMSIYITRQCLISLELTNIKLLRAKKSSLINSTPVMNTPHSVVFDGHNLQFNRGDTCYQYILRETLGSRAKLDGSIKQMVYDAYNPILHQSKVIKFIVKDSIEYVPGFDELSSVDKELGIYEQLSTKDGYTDYIIPLEDYLSTNDRDINYHIMIFDKGEYDLYNFAEKMNYRLSESTLNKIFVDLLDALHFFHINGYIHGDLSPENCVYHNHRWKLIDLEMTEYCGQPRRQIRSPVPRGKIDFSSPEIINHREYDHTSDLYSLAKTMYSISTGLFLTNHTWIDQGRLAQWIDRYQPPHPMEALNESFIDLLSNMLYLDPQLRLDHDGIMDHQWFVTFRPY